MTRRFEYDDKKTWIELPDQWLGEHANIRDRVVDTMPEGSGSTQVAFAISMSLLDDWKIEGLNGNPKKWEFDKLDLRLINWIRVVVIDDYNKCFIVPKALSSPSPNHSTATREDPPDGTSEKK